MFNFIFKDNSHDMTAKRLVFIALFFSFAITLFGQDSLNDINLFRIPQKKIREFIMRQKAENIKCFDDVKPTCIFGQDTSKFRFMEKTYLIKESLSRVWNSYHSVSPAKSWRGHIISFGVLFNKKTNKVFYADDPIAGIDTNDVMYVNLRLLRVYNLAVALEITKIDEKNKMIVFSYVNGGKSRGEQILRFRTTKNGYTEIIHDSLFRSNSNFRDKVLYPFFHKKAINEFHRNMRHVIRKQDKKDNVA